jgi:hypothetical protein
LVMVRRLGFERIAGLVAAPWQFSFGISTL